MTLGAQANPIINVKPSSVNAPADEMMGVHILALLATYLTPVFVTFPY